MKLRLSLALLVAAAASLAAGASSASAQTITYRAGPFHINGFQTLLPKLRVQSPHMDGYITKMNATLHYGNGKPGEHPQGDAAPHRVPQRRPAEQGAGRLVRGTQGRAVLRHRRGARAAAAAQGLRLPGARPRPLADADDADEPQLRGPQRVRAVHVHLHQAAPDAGAAVLDPRQRLRHHAAQLLGPRRSRAGLDHRTFTGRCR